MRPYRAPLDDIRFALFDLNDYARRLTGLPGYEEATPDVVSAVLEEAARFAGDKLLPLSAGGDAEGCRFTEGAVFTPQGYPEAYRAFAEAGWPSLGAEPRWGGQGLPKVVRFLLDEILASSNMAFGIFPGLSYGVYHALARHGSPEQQARYLPALVAGRWSGTMCLTEPQAGSDLGLIRCRAEPAGEGRYRLTGGKIFISAGEHDLTENIVHLVLARLPDAPAGTHGLSLFVVPKLLPDAEGKPGRRNAVACGRIEEKMGLHASPTCALAFDGAEGELVGAPHAGMKIMFSMMNLARLGVAVQAQGLAEAAYQAAVAYARERVQGHAAGAPAAGTGGTEPPADPILAHADVRRLLLSIRAVNEAARALIVEVGIAADLAERHPDPAERQAADDFVSLLTPVLKAYLSDQAFAAAAAAQQVFGGHGYIREWGVEQLVRDARITQIYEGTNGIQALDLVGRKLPRHVGRLLRRFFHPLSALLEEGERDPATAERLAPLAKAFGRLQQATAWLAEAGRRDPEQATAVACDYLRLFALVTLGSVWARTVAHCEVRLASAPAEEVAFLKAKLATAQFFFAYLLPESGTLFARIMAGKAATLALPDAAY